MKTSLLPIQERVKIFKEALIKGNNVSCSVRMAGSSLEKLKKYLPEYNDIMLSRATNSQKQKKKETLRLYVKIIEHYVNNPSVRLADIAKKYHVSITTVDRVIQKYIPPAIPRKDRTTITLKSKM